MTRTIATRARVVDSPNALEIHISPPHAPRLMHWATLVFLAVWIAFWTYFGAEPVQEIIRKPTLSSVPWFLGWLSGELFAAFLWAWLAFGREVIAVSDGMPKVGWGVGGLLRFRIYPLRDCTGIRASGWFGDVPFGILVLSACHRGGGGTVAFDCAGRTMRFGIGLPESEANAVAKELEPYIRPRAA